MLREIWSKSNLRVIVCYVIVVILVILIEVLITGKIWWSFWVSYIGLFYVARYVERGLNVIFSEFHITNKIRNLIIPWIFAGMIAVYCYSIFLTQTSAPLLPLWPAQV